MDFEKQRLVVSCLLANRDLLSLCNAIIRPEYFDASLKKSVKFLQDYFAKYKDVPKHETLKAETGIILEKIEDINKADVSYLATEIETFCRNEAVGQAILAGPALLEAGDFGTIIETLKAAISVGLQKDIGLDYFENPEERLHKTLATEHKISTLWAELDDILGGGICRQELILFAATSGGGKSMTMLNLAKNLLMQNLNGVYISLEMAEGVVSKRLDSMISHIAQENLLKEIRNLTSIIEQASGSMGQFIIKRLPENGTNINDIRSFLQQLEQSKGFKPDFIVVDYVDILGCTRDVPLDNVSVKDKYVTEEIRSLGFDFDCIMISASQLNRNAHDAEKLSQAHIAGGMTKINTTDYAVAIKQDDLMRAAGEIYLECLKSRNSNGVGQRCLLGWDPISLNIVSLRNKNKDLQLSKKPRDAVILSNNGTVFNKGKGDPILDLIN